MDYSKSANNRKRKSAVSKSNKAKNRAVIIGFRVIVSAIILSVFAAGGIVFGAYMGVIDSVAHLTEHMDHRPSFFSSVVLDMHGYEIDHFLAEQNREWVSLEQMPQHLQHAFIAIEDERFFEHNGVDIRGTLRALYVTLTTSRTEGGSTITQQLVKNNIMGISRNTPETKLQEQFLALQLEARLYEQFGNREQVKLYILENYLNTINLGGQLYGVQSASMFYFNKDVSQLTISESAVLASITQHPFRYNPANNPQYNRMRQTVVLSRMLAQGFITEEEHAYAYNDDVFDRISTFRVSQPDTHIRSYFVDHLFNTLVDDLIAEGIVATRQAASHIIHNGGLRIYTTKDPRIQNIMEAAYLDDSFFPAQFEITIEYRISYRDSDGNLNHRELEGTVSNREQVDSWVQQTREYILGETNTLEAEVVLPTPQPQSAMIVLDHNNGYVRGIVGGRGEKLTNLSFNRATTGRRHPGSVFKMIAAYAPAFDLGLLGPGSTLVDTSFSVVNSSGSWTPDNWQPQFRGGSGAGRINVRRAVADSFNRVAARTTYEMVGLDRAFDYVLNFGFDLPTTDRVPSIALGGLTEGVTQLEMAAAFGAIANEGTFIQPMVYTHVLDHDGNILLQANPQVRQVIRPEAAYLLTSTMEDVLTQGTGGGARLRTSMAVAGKTGTSQETRDLNFAGFTPHYTASIWLGHDMPRTIAAGHGHSHLRLWAHVMNEIHYGYQVISNFPRPSGIVTRQICIDSGLLAIPGICNVVHGGSRVRTDIFDHLSAPTHQCNVHGSVRVDILTGLPITGETPFYRQEVIVAEIDPETGLPVVENYYTLQDDDNYNLEDYAYDYTPEQPIYDLENENNGNHINNNNVIISPPNLIDIEGESIIGNNNVEAPPSINEQPIINLPPNLPIQDTPPNTLPPESITIPPVLDQIVTPPPPSLEYVPEFSETQFN